MGNSSTTKTKSENRIEEKKRKPDCSVLFSFEHSILDIRIVKRIIPDYVVMVSAKDMRWF